jgi:hypothetical protein
MTHQQGVVTFQEMDPRSMPLELVAQSFRGWFRRFPWLEVARCPECSPNGDYGAAGRYADFGNGACPVCGGHLEEYWSDERVAAYFGEAVQREGFVGLVGVSSKEVVAWAWCYSPVYIAELSDLPAAGLYVDTFGFLPAYSHLMGELFQWGHPYLREEKGVEYFVTRTHRDARYVQDAISAFGYRFLKASTSEPDREYWVFRFN